VRECVPVLQVPSRKDEPLLICMSPRGCLMIHCWSGGVPILPWILLFTSTMVSFSCVSTGAPVSPLFPAHRVISVCHTHIHTQVSVRVQSLLIGSRAQVHILHTGWCTFYPYDTISAAHRVQFCVSGKALLPDAPCITSCN